MFELFVNDRRIDKNDNREELDQAAWDYRVRGLKVEIRFAKEDNAQ